MWFLELACSKPGLWLSAMWQKKYNISKQEVYNYQKSAMEASGGYIEDKYFFR